ncbi:MAG: NUDIX domain-containing protein [Acidimicrobiales bacterium]|jgi:8-oxo-dGTP pyrophosphatase MutT (NUDIX family)
MTAPPLGDPAVAALYAAVDAHRPDDGREQHSRAEILDRLVALDGPFDRHAGPVHVTASAIVVGRRGVLLHRHRRLHRWLQPGGHLDPGELPADAARREAEEETGLVLSHLRGGPVMVHVDVHGAADAHVHLDIRYLLSGPDEDPAPPPGESQEVAWFTWDEAAALADEALAGALRSTRRLIAAGSVDVPGGTPEETDG